MVVSKKISDMPIEPPITAAKQSSHLRQLLENTANAEVLAVFREIAQALPYFGEQTASELVNLCTRHDAANSRELASDWVAGLWWIGGEAAQIALLDHAQGVNGSPNSRDEANRLARDISFFLPKEIAARATSASSLHLTHQWQANDDDELIISRSRAAELITQVCSADAPGQSAQSEADTRDAEVLATDCDGTTWAGDIGEAYLDLAITENFVAETAGQALNAMLNDYGMDEVRKPSDAAGALRDAFSSGELHRTGASLGMAPNTVTRDYYHISSLALAGRSALEHKRRARTLFEAQGGFRDRIFPDVLALLQKAKRLGVHRVAISASNQCLVEIGAEYLGLPPWAVFGARLTRNGDVLMPKTKPPFPFGPGKIDALRALTGCNRPTVAFGASVLRTDRELLDAAQFPVAIGPITSPPALAHINARRQSGYRILVPK